MDKLIKIPLAYENTTHEFDQSEEFQTIEIPESLISNYLHQRDDIFATSIKDDTAKDALLLFADLVVLIKLDGQPKNGDFVACQYDDQTKFGYFFKGKDQYKLQPAKPLTKAKDFILPSHFRIIGKIILVIRNSITDSPLSSAEVTSGFNYQFLIFHSNIKSLIRKKRRTKIFRIATWVIVLVIIAWSFLNIINLTWPQWTGFQQKTLWDWLELLIIPVVISFGIFLLNQGQKLSDQIKTEEISRENAFQQYLDKMTELLLDDQHGLSNKNSEERHMARTRTMTVLRGLDADRKGLVVKFLHEATLVQGNDEEVKVQLIASDLSYVNLSAAYLSEINLNGTNLYYANLQNSDLSGSLLQNSFLYGANLSRANMVDSDLSFANLEKADLTDTDLRGANLTGAILTKKQLQKAKSIDGANLPKGFSTDFHSEENQQDTS